MKLNIPKKINRKSLLKIILIAFFSLASLLTLFFVILFLLFLAYKDDISKTVLLSVNQKINGKISFSDITFTPFRHFPNAALKFYDLSLYESKDSVQNYLKPPVFAIKESYISVNVIDLFSSRINVSSISFGGGNFNVIVYPDSQINLEKAIGIAADEEKIFKEETAKADTLISDGQKTSEIPSTLELQIDNLELIDLKLRMENHLTKNKIQLNISELQSGFTYLQNQIVSSLNIDTSIDSMIVNNETLLSDQQIQLESEIEINTDSLFVKLDNGSVSIGSAEFLFKGIFDSKNQGYLDLSISGSDKDFSLFTLFLHDEGMKNLEAGDFLFEGSVKGKTFVEFPLIDFRFGMIDVELINPITKREIKNLNLKGQFKAEKNDFKNASLNIDTLFADLPDGSISLSGLIRNFKVPEVDINLFLSADVTGLEKVFKLDFIQNLKGRIELTDRIKGKYNLNENRFISEINSAKISFEDFGCEITGTLLFDKVNGVIRRENDTIYFENFSVISKDTDIMINGEVNNLQYLLLNTEKVISANLNISSSVFDLPNFLFFDPSIKRDFNYRILDVDVSVTARTTTSKATKFKSFPEIEFDIKKLDATIENFLPRLEINSGKFTVSEDLLGFNLKCDQFKTNFLNGDFNFSAEYNTSEYQPFYIKVKTDFREIYLSDLFYDVNDTVPEAMKGKLTGSFFTELQFPTDSTILKFIKLKNADLVYEFSKDTIVTENLSFDFNSIYFNEMINPNPLATLFVNGYMKADTIRSHSFNFNDVDFSINVTNGSYEIKSDMVRLFGENAKGKSELTLTPFYDLPSYQLKFNDVRFHAEKMLSAFMEDSVISGSLHLSLNLESTGSKWDSIVSNMSGTINLSGKNLLLNGIDADELIEKFKRSQSFNLVDLGAVLLAGPVGLAVTKGTDFARILVLNSGKTTSITELVSNWKINNGIFSIEDAAFITSKNRIALTGSIGFSNNNLDLTIALLNQNGCSVFSQDVFGNLDAPTMGKVKVVGTVLAPVTNLVDDVMGIDCEVFYNGSVKHPDQKKK